jgi:CDP-diacylglycerol pyrophosphatase
MNRRHTTPLQLLVLFALCILGISSTVLFTAEKRDRLTLWRIASNCVKDKLRQLPMPAACLSVDLSAGVDKGFCIIKDKKGSSHYLLIPTTRITGVEDQNLQMKGSINYWAKAWIDGNRYVAGALDKRGASGTSRHSIALAVNAKRVRGQDQLHIHISCLRQDVSSRLAALNGRVGANWSRDEYPLLGKDEYRIIWLPGTRPAPDPFKLMLTIPHAEDTMKWRGQQTLVVAPAHNNGRDGFYLIDGSRQESSGWGEGLLDEDCRG